MVDLTLPVRFANLPNNAKLEMVTSSRKQAVADSQVGWWMDGQINQSIDALHLYKKKNL